MLIIPNRTETSCAIKHDKEEHTVTRALVPRRQGGVWSREWHMDENLFCVWVWDHLRKDVNYILVQNIIVTVCTLLSSWYSFQLYIHLLSLHVLFQPHPTCTAWLDVVYNCIAHTIYWMYSIMQYNDANETYAYSLQIAKISFHSCTFNST